MEPALADPASAGQWVWGQIKWRRKTCVCQNAGSEPVTRRIIFLCPKGGRAMETERLKTASVFESGGRGCPKDGTAEDVEHLLAGVVHQFKRQFLGKSMAVDTAIFSSQLTNVIYAVTY
jgi:hypothetical protein